MRIVQKPFGEINGQNVDAYTLINDQNIEITCLNYGCVITKIVTPNRDGNYENIVLGFNNMEDYEKHSPYFGAVVGRVSGRIKGGQFELDGQSFELEMNDNGNHLHGGSKGFSHVLWDAVILKNEKEVGIQFSYTSPDGEEGYPGTVQVTITYLLNNDNEFLIHYQANSDKTTLLNLTNHTYFNLSGDLKRDALHHVLKIDSNQFVELNEQLLPTGELLDVTDTVFDFREGREIEEGVISNHPQNQLVGQGYDHSFLLNSHHNGEITMWDEESGRKLVVETDEVSVVLYTGNQLQEDLPVYGVKSKKYLGLCLETQGLPDAIHHPHFPSYVLEKDQLFSSLTKYTFLVD
ncbi:aldose epimerase family protein [Metabacillus rhizolycopersici]|uniref:Aldose 1-epimerase n=1 Tax=Metabacillus rhizolycopersici TaxID=2875709 RepID=A0ABS7USD2_9BACI|nr:aldose epimerase family protein [Metabacillus rhizolycopersici]MBZ5750865.1 galactose mutarotase [Metabacillus rhizolycopersici]